jgi:hypothetical protein
MSAQGIKAGEAYVVISAKLDQLRADLKKVPSEVSSGLGKPFSGLMSSITPVTAAIAAATAAFAVGAKAVHEFVSVGSQINDMAARTGMASDALQHMKFAADQTGTGLADVEKAARNFVKEGGNVKDFEAMGLAIASIQDPSERARQALDVFGKSGTKLLPMFQEFKSLKASSASLGPILTDAEVKAADALGDSFSSLKESISRAMQQIGAALGPYLQDILDKLIGAISSFADTLNALRNANSFGSGGDWLDVLANSDLYNPSGWGERGKQARQSLANSFRGGMPGMEDEESTKSSKDSAATTADMFRSIERANKSRIDLIREFETPAEKFIAKQNEINNALAQLNRNRVLGFISGGDAAGQRSGLEEALRRLRAQEQERLAGQFGTVEQATAERASAVTSSKGTFSAAAAALLGRSGDSAELRESKTQTAILKKIDDGIRKVARPAFS